MESRVERFIISANSTSFHFIKKERTGSCSRKQLLTRLVSLLNYLGSLGIYILEYLPVGTHGSIYLPRYLSTPG